jgi:hypothetical protein
VKFLSLDLFFSFKKYNLNVEEQIYFLNYKELADNYKNERTDIENELKQIKFELERINCTKSGAYDFGLYCKKNILLLKHIVYVKIILKMHPQNCGCEVRAGLACCQK